MKDEFSNRQNMHLTLGELLDLTEYHPVWKDQPPVVFTSRVTAFRSMVDALGLLIGRQQSATTGHAEDKEREEAELENTAYEISQTLAGWFEANGRNADAAQIDLSLTAWQKLRDTDLIGKAKLLETLLAAALADHAASLAEYDLTPADAVALAQEIKGFEDLVAAPSAAISRRRALTTALRPDFRKVSEILEELDRLVLRFRRTEPGARFAEAWQAARIVRDLGRGAGETPPPPAA